MKLKDFCIKEGKEYLLKEWDDKKTFRSHWKLSVIQVHCLYGGNAKKFIHGRRSSEADQLHLQSALNAVMLN